MGQNFLCNTGTVVSYGYYVALLVYGVIVKIPHIENEDYVMYHMYVI